MPSPGQVNNPGGSNSYGAGGVEEPYGAIERRKALTRMAPPGNQAVSAALNAPQRAQRKARKKQNMELPAEPVTQQVPQVNMLQQFWRELATEDGASDLVREYAAQAG